MNSNERLNGPSVVSGESLGINAIENTGVPRCAKWNSAASVQDFVSHTFSVSPGNLYSDARKIHLDPEHSVEVVGLILPLLYAVFIWWKGNLNIYDAIVLVVFCFFTNPLPGLIFIAI